jgi:conjugal transfer ATP-binding protein TraC
LEVVEISREERDVYLIPQNFVDNGTILGGTVKLRNAVEAAVLAVGSAVPLFYLPLAFNIRLMIVIAVSVPLGVFGVVGIGGDSLTQFVAHWFSFMKCRRIVTPTPQGNLEANRHRHLRFISKRYHVVYYEDADALPHNAQVLQRKADRHGKLVKRQTLYDLLPIEKIENGILHTTDDHYIKILEIEPINFLLRSPREQRSVIYSFASLLKVSPVRLQFKSFSRKADVNAYLDKLRRDAANEPDAAVRKRHMSYIRFVKRLGSRDAVSRRFFVIFQYEVPTNERNISYAEIVSTLETTARNFRTYLAQCGNAIVEHENEDEFLTDVFYTLLNRRTAVQVPLQERIQDVLASYLAQNDATALDKIPPAAFMIPPSLDLKHGRYLYMDGTYHAYLMIPADGYRAQVTAGWMALLVNAGEGIDVDLFLERQPKERMMQKIGQQIRINRSKIKDTSDTNSDFDDLSNAIRSGYYLKDGLANNEDFYYAAILVTVTAASVKDLEWRIGEIRKLMVSQDMNLQLCSFRQEAAFLSSLPLCAPDAALFKKYRRNILTSTAASFYPFVSFELCDTNGVLLGVNKHNNSLVSLDNFNTRIYKNANMAILGTSGAGKTFTMQLIARRMRLAGTPIYIIAPLKGHEFYRQAKALNGTIIRIVPGSPDCINVMEIRKIDHTSSELLDGPMPEQSELAAKIQKLHIFFSLLIPDLSNEERQLLDEAIVTTYRNKGITYSNASLDDPAHPGQYREMPILGDLHAVLSSAPETRRIANILNRLVHGSASSFNRQTNVNLDNSYVVIDISELSGDLLTVGMYIGLDYMWDKAKEDLTRRKQIFIDEVWQIIGASSNALAANYVFEAVKTIRGYGGGVLVATQDLNDFFSLEDGKYGRGILNNCKIKIILNLEEEEAQRVQSVLKLTDAEIDNIIRFERGSALIVTNSNNVTVDMRCSEEEKDLITTDRDELRRIVERKMQNQTETEES